MSKQEMPLSQELRDWSSEAGPLAFFNFMIDASDRATALEAELAETRRVLEIQCRRLVQYYSPVSSLDPVPSHRILPTKAEVELQVQRKVAEALEQAREAEQEEQ